MSLDIKSTDVTPALGNLFNEKEKLRRDLKDKKDGAKEALKLLTPEEIFAVFDLDDSGLISFEEFRKLLPYLNINISDAKAFRYFRLCDIDGSGFIDVDEFKVTLFICDPASGNQVGFSPDKNITPMDAFELFDEDQSGDMDEDEFVYAMEYLGISLSDTKADSLFRKYDLNNSGTIDYHEFRDCFLSVCDLRHELEQRGVDVPGVTSPATLRKMLLNILIEEEKQERQAIAEAKRHKEWIKSLREKRKLMQKAEFRAYAELRSALDLAGHVYVFGGGTNNQFNQGANKKLKTKTFEFEYLDKVTEIWKDRVHPQQLVDRLRLQRRAEEQDERRNQDQKRRRGELNDNKVNDLDNVLDPYVEAQNSLFRNLNVALNTAAIWGRRIHHVALSESVLFALADTGEVYAWGGKGHIWHEIHPDSIYQTNWRGDTTPRSQLLLGTVGKPLPLETEYATSMSLMSPEDRKAEVITIVSKYFNVFEPPSNPSLKLQFLEKVLMPKLSYDDIKFALKCRGKSIEGGTKYEMMEKLYEDILLEKKLLGERAHKAIRELETQVAGLLKRKKITMANRILSRIETMWKPLLEVQEEHLRQEQMKQEETIVQIESHTEETFQNWKNNLYYRRQNMDPEYTPRGNSLLIEINGITPRARSMNTPRGFQVASKIAAGANHACLIHKNGQLYSWGCGVSGRLGLDLTEGDPQKDVAEPKLVQALLGRTVVRVSCGQSHSAAIVQGGQLYMWGSASNGKLGLGESLIGLECYCSIPTKILIGSDDNRVKKVSCGSSHSAVLTDRGHIYVFGCGDGGRLGIGNGNYSSIYTPVLLDYLLHESFATISCGNSSTIASTVITTEIENENGNVGPVRRGGRVYVAGSSNVLGKDFHVMTLLENIKDIPIKQVSAGFRHSALVSAEGELYTWGHNFDGCCGADSSINFIQQPQVVRCLYSKPENMALGKLAYQSSTFNSREASVAVNGRREGMGLALCSCTQEDSQAWLEVNLGMSTIIEEIWVWNRNDPPKHNNQGLPHDYFTSRIFPFWLMVGRNEFSKGLNSLALQQNLHSAVAKMKFSERKRVSKWRLPQNTIGQFVRIQLQEFNFLNIAEIEVYGWPRISPGVGHVASATAGRDVTVAVIRPSTVPKDFEKAYNRAVYANSLNSDIIRQLESYTRCFDKFGRGENVRNSRECLLCRGHEICEICQLYEVYGDKIAKMPKGVDGRRRRLNSISEYLVNGTKPEIEVIPISKKERPPKKTLSLSNLKKLIDIREWFKPYPHISKEEALTTDPTQLYEDILALSPLNINIGSSINNYDQDKNESKLNTSMWAKIISSDSKKLSLPSIESSVIRNNPLDLIALPYNSIKQDDSTSIESDTLTQNNINRKSVFPRVLDIPAQKSRLIPKSINLMSS